MVGHNVASTPRASNQKDGLPRRFTLRKMGRGNNRAVTNYAQFVVLKVTSAAALSGASLSKLHIITWWA